jgi:hypothetical protein
MVIDDQQTFWGSELGKTTPERNGTIPFLGRVNPLENGRTTGKPLKERFEKNRNNLLS